MGQEHGRPWESGGDLPWDTPETVSEADNDAWRGALHGDDGDDGDDWPENLAGPEYWLYKKERDE